MIDGSISLSGLLQASIRFGTSGHHRSVLPLCIIFISVGKRGTRSGLVLCSCQRNIAPRGIRPITIQRRSCFALAILDRRVSYCRLSWPEIGSGTVHPAWVRQEPRPWAGRPAIASAAPAHRRALLVLSRHSGERRLDAASLTRQRNGSLNPPLTFTHAGGDEEPGATLRPADIPIRFARPSPFHRVRSKWRPAASSRFHSHSSHESNRVFSSQCGFFPMERAVKRPLGSGRFALRYRYRPVESP